MKLVFLHRFKDVKDGEHEFGGAERQLVDLARGLRTRGHDVAIVTFYSGGEMLSDADRGGVRIVSLDKSGRWDVVPFLWRLTRTLKRERADVLHGYLGLANALLVLTRPVHRGKVVWGVRASDIDITRYDWVNRFDAWIERVLSRFPNLIIANSNAGRDHAVGRGFPANKMTVIHNGIDLNRFTFDAEGRERLRAEWGVDPSQKLVGRVGRLDPQKDFPNFIAAAGIVAKSLPDVRFVTVGNDVPVPGDELFELARRLDLAERTIWAGPRGDMAAVYSALDLTVSSSAYGEGTPNVVAESMACGVPCVVTDVGDSAFAVGDLGQIVPRSNAAALAEGIIRALDQTSDPTALREHVATRFSIPQLVTRTDSALAGLLAGKRARA